MKRRLFKTFVAVLAIAAAAAGPVRGQNQQLTVYDVSSSTNVTPINGGFASQFNKCEMVYPASELAAMNGSVIKGLTFYSSTEFETAIWGAAQFQVFLREVADATISSYYGTTGATVVYEGSLSFSGDRMTVTFSTPYTYQGGNLLVGVYQPVIGTDATVFWYADVVTSASLGGRSATSLDGVTASVRDWLPKTTFSYGPAPQPHTVRMAAGTEEAANWTLASGNASVPGTQVLENVMSGSQVTATYNGTTKKVKSVKAVKYVPPVLVSSIVLNKQTAYLAKDSTLTLTASVLPENAADKSYTWSSDDITKATVNQNGVVTGVAGGTANIIATANDGSGVKDTCVVTVLNSAILDGVTVLYASNDDNWSTVMGYNPGVLYLDGSRVRLTSNGAFLYHDGHPVFVDDLIHPVFLNEYQWLLVTNIDGFDFYYHQGETWQQAISANRDYNEPWSINDGKVNILGDWILVDTNREPVDPTATIDPSTVNYELTMDN